MINKDINEIVLSCYPAMTKAEKKVADFVTGNPTTALQCTISEMAEQSGVGDTTVFRFCKTLGFDGFQSFKMSLAFSYTQNSVYDFFDRDGDNNSTSTQETCLTVLNTYVDSIKSMLASMDYQSIEAAVDLMYSARMIHFFGVGGSGITAQEATNQFKMVTPNVCNSIDSQIQMITAAIIDEQDVAVIFSYSGITREALEIARMVHEQSGKVVFVTKFSKTPAAKYADVLLISAEKTGRFEGGSISVRLLHSYLVDVLFTLFCMKMGPKSTENKKLTAISSLNRMF